jgi:hypothetical protein
VFAPEQEAYLSLWIGGEFIDRNQLISPKHLARLARRFKHCLENGIPIDDKWASCVGAPSDPENRDDDGLVLDIESEDQEPDLPHTDDESENSGEEEDDEDDE